MWLLPIGLSWAQPVNGVVPTQNLAQVQSQMGSRPADPILPIS